MSREIKSYLRQKKSPSTAPVTCLNSSADFSFGSYIHIIDALAIVVSSCGDYSCDGKSLVSLKLLIIHGALQGRKFEKTSLMILLNHIYVSGSFEYLSNHLPIEFSYSCFRLWFGLLSNGWYSSPFCDFRKKSMNVFLYCMIKSILIPMWIMNILKEKWWISYTCFWKIRKHYYFLIEIISILISITYCIMIQLFRRYMMWPSLIFDVLCTIVGDIKAWPSARMK